VFFRRALFDILQKQTDSNEVYGTMLNDKLNRLFEGALVPQKLTPPHPDVLWLVDESGKPTGFWRNQLTEKEKTLLMLLYKEYQQTPTPTNEVDKQWAEWLLEEGNVPNGVEQVHLVHFYLSEVLDDYEAFTSTWYDAYPHVKTLLWINQQYGVLVLDGADQEEAIEYENFSEAISTDFYVDLYVFIGIQSNVSDSKEFFFRQEQSFHYLLSTSRTKHVYQEHEVLPLYLMRFVPETEITSLLDRLITADLLEDKELLSSITTYFEHNLNTTQAAKALHMHRNSLQYRIDKFVERTGIDIKQFSQATLVYFLLLLHNHS
jgi:DNA-binding PucR family transcriptional regulator